MGVDPFQQIVDPTYRHNPIFGRFPPFMLPSIVTALLTEKTKTKTQFLKYCAILLIKIYLLLIHFLQLSLRGYLQVGNIFCNIYSCIDGHSWQLLFIQEVSTACEANQFRCQLFGKSLVSTK